MKIQFLGTGAAEGIPSFGCTCQRCQVARKEGGPNVRQRASVLIEAAGHRILLDTPPEINSMLNQAEVFDLSAILLSHEHFDHIGGLIAFEYWNRVLPIFAGYDVLPKLRLTPRLEERALLSGFYPHTRLHFGDLSVMPFKVIHHVPCYGFAFEEAGTRVLHFSDSGPELGDLHRHLMEGADVAIFHTPTFEPHRSHIGVQELISLVQDYPIQRVVITHINHDNLLHAELVEKTAPHGITVAYDGLTLEV
ncbi:MAG: MBL fold metallo-hydrolase [Chloroflexi bacterium]|nr:MBL fold metallo-hydrolase [Chloroflexota bacterium]